MDSWQLQLCSISVQVQWGVHLGRSFVGGWLVWGSSNLRQTRRWWTWTNLSSVRTEGVSILLLNQDLQTGCKSSLIYFTLFLESASALLSFSPLSCTAGYLLTMNQLSLPECLPESCGSNGVCNTNATVEGRYLLERGIICNCKFWWMSSAHCSVTFFSVWGSSVVALSSVRNFRSSPNFLISCWAFLIGCPRDDFIFSDRACDGNRSLAFCKCWKIHQ